MCQGYSGLIALVYQLEDSYVVLWIIIGGAFRMATFCVFILMEETSGEKTKKYMLGKGFLSFYTIAVLKDIINGTF